MATEKKTEKKNKFRETPILESTFVEEKIEDNDIEEAEAITKKNKEKKLKK